MCLHQPPADALPAPRECGAAMTFSLTLLRQTPRAVYDKPVVRSMMRKNADMRTGPQGSAAHLEQGNEFGHGQAGLAAMHPRLRPVPLCIGTVTLRAGLLEWIRRQWLPEVRDATKPPRSRGRMTSLALREGSRWFMRSG